MAVPGGLDSPTATPKTRPPQQGTEPGCSKDAPDLSQQLQWWGHQISQDLRLLGRRAGASIPAPAC